MRNVAQGRASRKKKKLVLQPMESDMPAASSPARSPPRDALTGGAPVDAPAASNVDDDEDDAASKRHASTSPASRCTQVEEEEDGKGEGGPQAGTRR